MQVAVASLFLVTIGACYGSTSYHSNEGGHCSANFDTSNDDTSRDCFPCLERFLAESYFRNYDHLVDSSFKEFISHQLHEALPKSWPKLSNLRRHLIGEGSHRRLTSYITLNFPPTFKSDNPKQQCELIVVERLPNGVFADPFELEHLLHRRVFNDAAVFGDTNLELPSFLSNRSLVEVHSNVSLQYSTAQEDVMQLNIEIPIHARYQPVGESSVTKVQFGAPDLFLRCSEAGTAQSCSSTLLNYSSDIRIDSIAWSIPSGVQAHAGIVSAVTFSAALLSTVMIVVTSLRHSVTKSKTLKQS